MSLTFQLSGFFISKYKADNTYLLYILDLCVPQYIMLHLYKILILDKEIKPIESLPEEDKKLLVDECRSTGLSFNNERLINSAKILHVIKYINSYEN